MQRIFLPMRSPRAARLLYAAVLDGQTVNLHAQLPRSIALPEHATLVLQRGRRRCEGPARVYEERDGRLLMDAAILLGSEAGGLPVDDGRWKVVLSTRSGRRSNRIPFFLSSPRSLTAVRPCPWPCPRSAVGGTGSAVPLPAISGWSSRRQGPPPR